MSAISAVRRQMKEMSDGTIRVYIDIDMHCKDEFLANYPIDTPIAIARLTLESTQASAQQETIDKPKGGFLSNWLALRCKEPEFWSFIEYKNDIVIGWIKDSETANMLVKEMLEIESKTELDNDKEAEARFHAMVRLPYAEWLTGRR